VKIAGALTVVREATEADVDRLVEWHGDPNVARYWDDETFTREEMQARLARRDVEAYIVLADDFPIGYLQVWTDDGASRTSGGIDMFLIPTARGRGLGPDAARAVARHFREERNWTRITVDPYAWNDGAVRAWERAGFVRVDNRAPDADHTAPWILMEFRD
jgi:aminoglycoside 6'-N-acetyltransferase